MAALAALLVAVIVVSVAGGFGAQERTAGPAPGASATSGPLPVAVAAHPSVGLAFGHPWRWRRRLDHRVVQLRSPGRRIGIAVAPAPRSVSRAALRHELEQAVIAGYPGARVLRRRPARVASRPALATEIAAGRASRRLEILVLAVASRWRTYGITVFATSGASRRRVTEAQDVLNSLRFLRPG